MRGDERGWNHFLITIDRPDIFLDPRFSTTRGILDHLRYLPQAINDTLREWRYEDLRRLVQDEIGGTIAPLHTLDSLLTGE